MGADLRFSTVVFDCRDPYVLARFWAATLGYGPERGDEDWVALQAEAEAGDLEWVRLIDASGDPSDDLPEPRAPIAFQRVPEPKSGKNRLHLDLSAADEEAEARRLESLGATRLWASEDPGDMFIVLGDPEGNEFCIVRAD